MITVVLVAALGIAFGLLGLSRGVVVAILIPIVGVLIALAFRYGPESEVGVKVGSPRRSSYEDRPGTARG
jgi:lipoprotein signal peptidase